MQMAKTARRDHLSVDVRGVNERKGRKKKSEGGEEEEFGVGGEND